VLELVLDKLEVKRLARLWRWTLPAFQYTLDVSLSKMC
jgi:hypothetical protein